MGKIKIPLLLYSGEETNANFAYFSGLGMRLYDHSFLFLDGKKRILIVSKMNEKLGRAKFRGRIIVYEELKKELKKLLKGKRIGIDGNNLNVRVYNLIKKFSKPKDVSEELLEKRSRKSREEVGKIKKACKITKEIIYSVDLKKLKTEKEVEKELLLRTAELGLEPAFKPIVAASKNSSFPHYTPGNYRLRDCVLIDYGVRYRGYCGDVARCFSLRKGPWERDYETIKQVAGEVIDYIPECSYSSEVVRFVNGLYKKYKLGEELHSVGHGIGLEVHEFPRFSKKYKDEIKNTVFTVEPGFYKSKWGVRFEECVYFDGGRARVL